jgi:hypothetical protein
MLGVNQAEIVFNPSATVGDLRLVELSCHFQPHLVKTWMNIWTVRNRVYKTQIAEIVLVGLNMYTLSIISRHNYTVFHLGPP